MNNQQIQVYAKEIHRTAVEKGWWEGDRNLRVVFMLFITELSEAVEAHREDRWASSDKFKEMLEDVEFKEDSFKHFFNLHIKDTVEDELADTYIRILDHLYYQQVDTIEIPRYLHTFKEDFAENIFYICDKITEGNVIIAAALIEQLAEHMDIDLQWHIEQKMKYNEMREKMHGGKKY